MKQEVFLANFEMHLSILLMANMFNIGFHSKNIDIDAKDLLKKLAEQMKVEEKQIAEQILSTVRGKSNDYADSDDAFKNFRLAQSELGVSISNAIKIRMLDKISRIRNLEDEKKERKVEDEKLEDTYMDLIAYMIIEHIFSNPNSFKV